ncbi:MAG: twin-arginine translocase TatA/TatE family subunit [Rikenellaceae bacterium]|nr:twin-arginine translocase TatA/TatE family subunit [Rikenellaceae bacterium]
MFTPCVIGIGQIAIIALVVILLFGGSKIPELMRGMGRGVKEFKDAVNKDYTAEEKAEQKQITDKKE